MGERYKPHSYRYSPQPPGRTTPSSSWDTVASMEMAVESMEMAPGAIPRPGRVPKQRFLSPKLRLRRLQWCGTLSGKTLIDLGFSRQRDYIGGRAMSGGGPGGHTTWWRGQRGGATLWCACLLAPLRLPFGLRVVLGKIGTSGFVSSNSKNISCVTFLKHKNSRKQETSTVASR
jgi:hypothetical protein